MINKKFLKINPHYSTKQKSLALYETFQFGVILRQPVTGKQRRNSL